MLWFILLFATGRWVVLTVGFEQCRSRNTKPSPMCTTTSPRHKSEGGYKIEISAGNGSTDKKKRIVYSHFAQYTQCTDLPYSVETTRRVVASSRELFCNPDPPTMPTRGVIGMLSDIATGTVYLVWYMVCVQVETSDEWYAQHALCQSGTGTRLKHFGIDARYSSQHHLRMTDHTTGSLRIQEMHSGWSQNGEQHEYITQNTLRTRLKRSEWIRNTLETFRRNSEYSQK
jgi:hypothetical protein